MSILNSAASLAPFAGGRVLIYGGAQGIGRSVALEFARRGAAIAVADINAAGAEETAGQINAAGGKALSLACDVTDEAAVHATAAEAERRLGEIDIVVNNVGVILNGNPQDIPTAEWRRIMDLNFFSVIYSNGYFLPKLVERGRGHIVNVGSFAGLYPFAASRMPYVAAKAAVIALSESLALYLQPLGVRVSCLCPGPVATNVRDSMKTWSADVAFRGPGSQYHVIMPDEAAVILADGMRDGRVVIPTDEKVWEVLQRHAADADQFLHDKMAEFARGDSGMPTFTAS
jgi:NAD(P)-dependent dehydrogenase (short-subunit alcohol dehydrogenase family)